MEYIIDGTNIININGERSLAPLLNLVLGLMDRRASFVCYFEFTTKRAHLTNWLERKIYDLITTQSPAENASAFFGNGRFIQVIQTKKADELILRRAKELKHAYVISRDLYRQEIYENEYGWTIEDRKHRLCSVEIVDDELLLIYKDIARINVPYETDVLRLVTELINRLEAEKGTLEGKIIEFDDAKRVGKIQLAEKRGRKIRFRDKTVKNDKLDYRKKGLAVSFVLEPHVIINDEPKKNTLLFEAGNLIEILDPQKALQKVKEDNRNLIQKLDKLQHELVFCQKKDIQTKAELETLRQQISELQKLGDRGLVKKIERLAAERENQQSLIDKLKVNEQSYKSEIDNLKSEINTLESLIQFYKSNLYDTPKGVKEFWFEDISRAEELFSIYEGWGKPRESQQKEKATFTSENQYLVKIYLLEEEIEQLKAEITAISSQDTAYSSRIKISSRYREGKHGGYYAQKNQIDFLNQEIYALKATVSLLKRELNKEGNENGIISDLEQKAYLSKELALKSDVKNIFNLYTEDLKRSMGIFRDVFNALEDSNLSNRFRALKQSFKSLETFSDRMELINSKIRVPFIQGTYIWKVLISSYIDELGAHGDFPLPNPFVTGNAIQKGDNTFVGRSDIIDQIKTEVLRLGQNGAILFRGNRRTGKTSTLNNMKVSGNLPSNMFIANIDCQSPESLQTDEFYAYLVESISGALGLFGDSLEKDVFSLYKLNKYLLGVDEFLINKGNYCLICLDEFEKLGPLIQSGQLEGLADSFRYWIQNLKRIVFLFAGSNELSSMTDIDWSSYLINVRTIPISFLEKDAGLQLVTRPTIDFNLTYQEENLPLNLINRLGRQPYLIQSTIFELTELLNRDGHRKEARQSDIDEAIIRMFTSASQYFEHTWKTEISEEGRKILVVIGRNKEIDPQNPMLRKLKRMEVLRKNEKNEWDFCIPVFKEWLYLEGEI